MSKKLEFSDIAVFYFTEVISELRKNQKTSGKDLLGKSFWSMILKLANEGQITKEDIEKNLSAEMEQFGLLIFGESLYELITENIKR